MEAKYSDAQSELRFFVPRPVPGHLAWVCPDLLGCHTTAFALIQSSTHKWRLSSASISECGALDQATVHVILECPLHRAPRGYHGLLIMDNETRSWLNNIVANIWREPIIRRSMIWNFEKTTTALKSNEQLQLQLNLFARYGKKLK